VGESGGMEGQHREGEGREGFDYNFRNIGLSKVVVSETISTVTEGHY